VETIPFPNVKPYEEGYKLQDGEYLLKIRPADGFKEIATGFLTKYTQKGEIPKSFDEWGTLYDGYKMNFKKDSIVSKLPIYIYKEEFCSGWKLYNWRFGMSQNWAEMIHPGGFVVEIYLQQFLEILKDNVLTHNELIGRFKWEDKKLIKQP
jgi:hypothetical protein